MPKPLNSTNNIETIKNWLDENLTNENLFTPIQDAIPQDLSKGICFWLMKREGYKILSEHITDQALEAEYSKEINEVQFDLVYLEEIYKAEKTITKTLNWHIDNVNDINALKKSSPLRKVIGALLSDDLLEANIQKKVSNFICENLMVFWISGFDCEDNKIINTASILKSHFFPLFDKNHTSTDISKEIMVRTDKVYYNTIKNIEGITYDYLNYINKELTSKVKSKNIATWIVDNRWNCDNIGYKEISLKNTEIDNLMGKELNKRLEITNNGIIIFKLFGEILETRDEEEDNDNAIWPSQELSGWRYTRSKEQDLLGYFQNVDTGDVCRKYESIINNMGDLQNIYFKFYYLKS
jgi:hypothetical protein